MNEERVRQWIVDHPSCRVRDVQRGPREARSMTRQQIREILATTLSQTGDNPVPATNVSQTGDTLVLATTLSQTGDNPVPATNVSQTGDTLVPATTLSQTGDNLVPATTLSQPIPRIRNGKDYFRLMDRIAVATLGRELIDSNRYYECKITPDHVLGHVTVTWREQLDPLKQQDEDPRKNAILRGEPYLGICKALEAWNRGLE